MTNKPPFVLELNNIDILGRRFNGYDLLNHFKQNPVDFEIDMLVNNRLSVDSKAKNLFRSGYTEECDWIVQAVEKKYLGTKNEISLAEEALKENPLYKKANILHFHLYHNMNLPIEFLERIPASKKIIIDIHDTFWLSDKNIPMLEVFNYTNTNKDSLSKQRKRILNNIDAHFVVHSPYILNLFHKSSITKNLKNVHFINFGIDLNIFKPLSKSKISNIKSELGIPKNNIVLLCRAQQEFKGIDYIINALKTLKTEHPISVITVNNTEMLNELKDTYQIIDAGVIYDERRMAELFNACDIFLSPSTEESFGFMAVEAMACGKPVIVFEGTALPHTTGAPKAGFAVKRGVKTLQNAIDHLINHPDERVKRSKLGINFVHKNYNKNSYFKNYENLFKEVDKVPRKPIITQAYRKTTPKTLKKLTEVLESAKKEILEQTSLPLKNYNYPIIDYNATSVQSILYDFNHEIYYNIKTSHKTRHLIYSYKRNVPEPIKKKVNYIRRVTTYPIRKIIKIIKRRKS